MSVDVITHLACHYGATHFQPHGGSSEMNWTLNEEKINVEEPFQVDDMK